MSENLILQYTTRDFISFRSRGASQTLICVCNVMMGVWKPLREPRADYLLGLKIEFVGLTYIGFSGIPIHYYADG